MVPSPYELIIQDEEGALILPLELAEDQPLAGIPTRVYPTHWLGDHHPAIERFRWFVRNHLDHDSLELEASCRDYILNVTTELVDQLWSTLKYEVANEGTDPAQATPGLP